MGCKTDSGNNRFIMALSKIEDIIADVREGKMVILMDDEDRENEGDIIVAAEKVTPEIINFMATEARGLICLPLTGDRARTILAAVNPMGKPEDIVQPGHIFPLRARPGGVLSRAGHTEAGCDLARLAGLIPAAAIVEVINPDGTMARRADLIHYRLANEKTVESVEQQTVTTEYGEFTLHTFQDSIQKETHLALTMGDITPDEPTLVRVQTNNQLRDVLGLRKDGNLERKKSKKVTEQKVQEEDRYEKR